MIPRRTSDWKLKEQGKLDDREQDSFFLVLEHIRKLKWKDSGKVEGNEDVAAIDPYQVKMVLAERKWSCSFSLYMK